jgi:hypothetical protein
MAERFRGRPKIGNSTIGNKIIKGGENSDPWLSALTVCFLDGATFIISTTANSDGNCLPKLQNLVSVGPSLFGLTSYKLPLYDLRSSEISVYLKRDVLTQQVGNGSPLRAEFSATFIIAGPLLMLVMCLSEALANASVCRGFAKDPACRHV